MERDKHLIASRVRGWFRTTLSLRQLTAEEWARKAGVAGTTITRALAREAQVPSLEALVKLSRAAGLPLPDFDRGRWIPFLTIARGSIESMNSEASDGGQIEDPTGAATFAVRLEEDLASDLLAGDVLYVQGSIATPIEGERYLLDQPLAAYQYAGGWFIDPSPAGREPIRWSAELAVRGRICGLLRLFPPVKRDQRP